MIGLSPSLKGNSETAWSIDGYYHLAAELSCMSNMVTGGWLLVTGC